MILFPPKITEENNHVSTSWSWCQTVIRMVTSVIIVQPWSITMMEACSYSTVINCCCHLTGLSVRFDTKVNLLCSYIRSIDLPSICVCVFVLYFVWLRPLLELLHSLNRLWSVSWTRVLLLKVTCRPSEAAVSLGADGQQALLLLSQLRTKGSRSALTTQSPIEKHAK